jgi:hypothetical protein
MRSSTTTFARIRTLQLSPAAPLMMLIGTEECLREPWPETRYKRPEKS